MLPRVLLCGLLCACAGAADESAPATESAPGDCLEVINPPQVPNCCRTPELEAEFIPTSPVCWRDDAAYDEWRARYRAAYRAGDCKAVHGDDACVFD